MSRNTKIILGIIAALVVICICVAIAGVLAFRQIGQAVEQSIVTDPTQAAAAAGNIADYDLPEGWTQTAMSLFGMNMVIIEANDEPGNNTVVMMMQFPQDSGVDQEQMNQQMQQAMEQQTNRQGVNMQVVGTKTYTIRGEEVVMSISEGTDSEGNSLRQMTGSFPGKSGQAVLMIMGNTDNWNEEEIDAFIDSIR